MKTKHIFVTALDVSELLPFCFVQTKKVKDSLKEEERARKELEKFIDILEKKFKEPIWYMGADIIGEKSYERFIFEKGGFFEIMVEPPVAMNAHFVHEKRAEDFCKALKKALTDIMPKNAVSKMFVDSIEVQSEYGDSLTVDKWSKMKKIRNL